jgi:hypothetical protein
MILSFRFNGFGTVTLGFALGVVTSALIDGHDSVKFSDTLVIISLVSE